MPQPFGEKTPLEKGFAKVFHDEIAPSLEPLENDRRGLGAKTRRDIQRIIFVSIGLAALTLFFAGPANAGLALLPLIAGVVLAVMVLVRRQAHWERAVVDVVVPIFCRFLGSLAYARDYRAMPFLAPFEQVGLIGPSNRQALKHHFSGVHRDTAFDFVHASLHRRSSRQRGGASVFNGLLFRIHVPSSAPVPITVMPNFGTLQPLLDKFTSPTAAFQRVDVNDPAFEEKFHLRAVISDPRDELAVRAFVSQDFRAALVAINEAEGRLSYGRSALGAAFVDEMFYLTLSRYEAYQLGPLQYEIPRPFLATRSFLSLGVDLEATIHGMFDDVSVAYRIIDLLHGIRRDEHVHRRSA